MNDRNMSYIAESNKKAQEVQRHSELYRALKAYKPNDRQAAVDRVAKELEEHEEKEQLLRELQSLSVEELSVRFETS